VQNCSGGRNSDSATCARLIVLPSKGSARVTYGRLTVDVVHLVTFSGSAWIWETCGGVNGSGVAMTPGQESTLQSPGLLGRLARRAHAGQCTPGARGTKSADVHPFTVPMKYGRKTKVTSDKVSWVSQKAMSCASPERLYFAVVPLMRPLMANKSVVVQQRSNPQP
jgi:hypothetical protein